MARRYYERYPFILDWSNLQGKTALHVAAIKGNEEFVRVRSIAAARRTSARHEADPVRRRCGLRHAGRPRQHAVALVRTMSCLEYALTFPCSASAWGHLHVRALALSIPRTDPAQIIQILIERGCQFAAKNVEGFTASDYAYSFVLS